ncbi:MAG: CDP-alcohol phosphatidyltransferase family protein [Dehalococcoidia bacterium]|jgi:phosphatidylglycerophosphate synthase|nr:CDP-alcohol phosphatidyltransferase family protein [Dehalococcoidia bacterium]
MTASDSTPIEGDKGTAGLDGPISRYLNRPLSRFISARVADQPITADHWSGIAFAAAMLGATAFALRLPRLGALLVHTGSVLDGVDGEVARAQGTAGPSGALFDLALDRTADVAILAGIAHGGGGRTTDWLAALTAANGIVGASVVKERLSAEGVRAADTQRTESEAGWQRALLPLGGRDGRLFSITLLGLARRPRLALYWLAVQSTVRLVERVRTGRRLLDSEDSDAL